MQRLAAFGVGICFLFSLVACNDPKDPQTWIKKLRDPDHANKAVKELRKLGDPVAVKPLCELFKDFPSPTILSTIIFFKDKRSIPTLIEALDFTEDQYHNATKAAKALADFKASEAVEPMCKVLDKPMAIKSRANLAKLSTIKALGRIGDKKAVPCLIKTLSKRPEEQDFLLNKNAAVALGKIGDPRAVPVLIRGLFMASTIQGTSYPQARVSLVKIGKPAIQPMIAALQGKDEALNKMAKDLDFQPGVMLGKISRVLGDMLATEAIPALLEILAKANISPGEYTKGIDGVIEGLGKSFDERTIKPLLALLQNKKADYKIRMQVCNALTVLGTKKALPILLEGSQKWFIEGGYTNLKDAAAMAYGRLVGAEVVEGYPIFKKMHDDEKNLGNKKLFKEVLERMEVAKDCNDDAACYGKKVTNDKLTLAQREKAGLMIGSLADGRKALPDLVKALPVREPVLRLYYLQAAKKIGKATDTDLVQTLEKLAEKDSKRKVKFIGADLASEDKVALAVIKNKAQAEK